MLLGTYTTENASQAREEAQRCIVASLADPQTFLLDHLLQLKPVKFLEGERVSQLCYWSMYSMNNLYLFAFTIPVCSTGELIHDLLKIFVSEKLEAYQKFYENHREYVSTNLKLNHEKNLAKMKLLTFMQLAETKSVITFGEIQKHMQLGDNEVEEFLIERKLMFVPPAV